MCPRGLPWFFPVAEAGPIPDRPDQESFHTRQSPRPRLRDSKVRKRPGPPRNELVVQMCDRSSAAIRRAHSFHSRDQARGRARRWRIERIVVRQALPHLTNRWRDRREILAPNDTPPRERALAREHFEFRETLAQPENVQLIDGKHSDATLRTARTTNKPLATSTRGIGQGGVHDLDQLLISRRWLTRSHFSKDNLLRGRDILNAVAASPPLGNFPQFPKS